MKLLNRSQKGFTLMELLIALPIIAIVVAAASGALIQVIQSTSTSAHMVALRQVQTAGYFVSKDGIQAQIVSDNDPTTLHIDVDDPITSETEILILKWTDWDNNFHQVIYSLKDMPSGDLKQLQRTENGAVTGPPILHIDNSVDPDTGKQRTSCDWTSDKKEAFTFKVTASVAGARGQQTETRTYEIKPRPGS